MPYTVNSSVRIHYHTEGDGPPLVLQHGGFGSIEDWYEYGYVNELKHRFRLVLMDDRAHGRSGKPHDPEQYSPRLRAGDVAAVLDEINIAKCHYLGFSLGGRMGFWLARYYPDRLLSLMVLGSHPYASDLRRIREAIESIDVWAPTAPNITEKHRSRLVDNDKRALALGSQPWSDDSDILHSLSVPCLIACGDRDGPLEGAKRSASESKAVTFVQLDGFDHGDTLVRSDVIIPLMSVFCLLLG